MAGETKNLKANTVFKEGYGLMPNTILFDQTLSSTAKLLYCLLSSLSAREGFCYATNKYLAEKMNMTARSIPRVLVELDSYINVEVAENNKRIITCFGDFRKDDKNVMGGVTKMSYPHDKNVIPPSRGDDRGEKNPNIINKKDNRISKEKSDQIEKLYTGYLIQFKLPTDHPALSDPDYKQQALAKARSAYRLTDLRKRKLAARLEDCGYDMIKKAIINCSKSAWHRGDDPKSDGWYAKLEWICGSYEKVEEWANRNED